MSIFPSFIQAQHQLLYNFPRLKNILFTPSNCSSKPSSHSFYFASLPNLIHSNALIIIKVLSFRKSDGFGNVVLQSAAKFQGFKLDFFKGQGNDVENDSIVPSKYYPY